MPPTARLSSGSRPRQRCRRGRRHHERADLRLAYMQHPARAQGVTGDTTHLIIADRATAEGTYVALTRARQRTDIYAGGEMLLDSELSR